MSGYNLGSSANSRVQNMTFENPLSNTTQNSGGLSQGTQAAIGAGASAIGGILQARAAAKAEQRQVERSKSNNRVTIEQRKNMQSQSILANLASNLANTMLGGR